MVANEGQNRLKVQLKLSISRLRMIQRKDSAIVKQQRREIAQYIEVRHSSTRIALAACHTRTRQPHTVPHPLTLYFHQNGRVQYARIKIEHIIRTDITTELHEILELYCELLLARSQLLESQVSSSSSTPSSTSTTLDPALEEAVRSIIYAAPRTEVKELHTVRALLVEKFGKDIAVASIEGEGVSEKVVKKLRVETPSEELVELYMTEIAKLYRVDYGTVKSDDDEPSGGVAEEEDAELEDPLFADAKKNDHNEALANATTPKKLGPQSPLRVVPPSPSTDNVAPRLKLPGAKAEKVAKSETKKPVKKEDGLGKIPDVDELARRFAELKR
jgi:hypothetical protein